MPEGTGDRGPRASPWERRGLFWGGWTLSALFFASQHYLIAGVISGQPVTWTGALLWTLPDWYLWAALSLLIVRLGRRFPLDRPPRWRALTFHLAASLVFSLVHLVLTVTALGVLLRWEGEPFSWSRSFSLNLVVRYHWNVLTYWGLLIASIAFDTYARLRDRELQAARLASQLSRAELHALRSQLHPHFLFNTLHSVTALIHSRPDAAERMLARLGDLLRLTLESEAAQEVPLRQEVRFLESYLEIERIRLGDRLDLRLEVDPGALDARVPSLVLQPLVENAIRHGVAPREEAGRIEITARRDGERLAIEVADDGPGLPAGGGVREGLGLANTRARLRQLYDGGHRFELARAPLGGLLVRMEIPFRGAEPVFDLVDG